jgi:tRNA nucleotidyltransferase/poly(A) polymerase
VRDGLLQHLPKDYDVATSALPEQVRDVFGRKRTLAIGQSFGVITVIGPKEAGQIDVATFRRDAAYSDGRHPDSVAFSTAEFDAQRRDFTINGLFYDPLQDRVIDYVGGQEDLQRRVIRAIGDPSARIAEDKLRMLRAVRFAATFDFELDPATLEAIQKQAHELVIVSAERIAAEMRRMLVNANRAIALRLLQETNLLEIVLPESAGWFAEDDRRPWVLTQRILAALEDPSFATALAAMVRTLRSPEQSPMSFAETICRRWKLANEDRDELIWLLQEEATIRSARHVYWPKLQRVLVDPRAGHLLTYVAAIASVEEESLAEVDFCRAKRRLPAEMLDPPPLLSGDDLKQLGIAPGPLYRNILAQVRDAQLLGDAITKDVALQLAQRLADGTATT